METLTQKLKEGIATWSERQGFCLSHKKLVLAVSGGSDSVAMLALFNEIASENNLDLHVLHINHGIREEAGEDQQYVSSLSQRLGVPFILRTIELGECSIEEMARRKRYEIYESVGKEIGGDILLAHTANDQVETVLFNMFRGTGPRGLDGMPFYRELAEGVAIFRPLMFATRRMLESFLKYRGIEWRQDYSNYDINFSRNYIRYNVIPNLTARFGEKSLRKVTETTDLQRELVAQFEDRVERLYIGLPYNIYAIACNVIKRRNTLIFGEALRQILSRLNAPLSRFSTELVKRIQTSLDSKTIEVFDNIRCEFFRGFLFVYRESNIPTLSEPVNVTLGSHIVPNYGELIIAPGRDKGNRLLEDGTGHATLAISSSSVMYITNPGPGETFHPFKTSERRFTQFARDRKIPRFLRSSLPVMYIDGTPAWTMGAGISNLHKVTEDDSLFVHATLTGEWIKLIESLRHYL